ncbi:hypothetical protein FQZ97_1253810 [compost metagenome]
MRPYCSSALSLPARRRVSPLWSLATTLRLFTTSLRLAARLRGMSGRRISSSATRSGVITSR